MKSILIPIMGFGPSGGMRVLSKMADQFIKKGFHVVFLAPSYSCKPYYPTEACIEILKVDCKFGFKWLVYLFKSIFWVFRNGNSYDIGLANYWMTAYVLKFSNIFSRMKCFYYVQAYEPEFYDELKGLRYRFLSFLAKFSYKLGLKIVVNAELYKEYKEIRSQFVVEPGLDVDLFKINDEKKHSDSIVVGCIGRKEAWKGTGVIFEAVSFVAAEINKKIILNVAFNLPDKYSLHNNVQLNLLYPHGDCELSKFYNETDLFIATGYIQSGAFHYPCMEALACGKLVITNYSPGTKENSIHISEVNFDNLVSALKYAIINPCFEKNDFLKFSNEIREKYSWDQVSDKMIKIFESRN